MLNKTTKTILFASLIAAMILPFSMMDVSAAPNENANEKAKEKTKDLKNKVAKAKDKLNKDLKKAEKDSNMKKEHKDRIKRDLYRADLIDQIISLDNWDDVENMTPEDKKIRDNLADLLHQSGEEEEKLRLASSLSVDDVPIINAHSQGSWDAIYHTSVTGSVYCGSEGSKSWSGKSDGYIMVYSSASTFHNVWDYDEELWKNSSGGCANPPNEHYSNTLKAVDLLGTASDCYASTTQHDGSSSRLCSGFTEGDFVGIYTRGTYQNDDGITVYMESGSGGWGLGTIMGL